MFDGVMNGPTVHAMGPLMLQCKG